MQAITDAKRRLLQTAAEKLGNAERVTRDETQMKQLLEDFKLLEGSLKTLHEMLKAKELAEQRNALASNQLAQCMATAFASLPDLAEQSANFADTMQRKHELVSPSVSFFVEQTAQTPLEHFMQDRIPQLKRRIAEHKNLEIDLSSYSRRVKAITDRPDGGVNNPELVKLKEKLRQVEEQYGQFHDALLNELVQLEEDKLDVLRPLFNSVLAAEGERQRLVYHELHGQIHLAGARPMMREVEEIVNQGGPERDSLLKRQPSRRTVAVPTFKGLFKTSSGNNPPPPPPPPAQQAFSTPIVVKHMSNPSPPQPLPASVSPRTSVSSRTSGLGPLPPPPLVPTALPSPTVVNAESPPASGLAPPSPPPAVPVFVVADPTEHTTPVVARSPSPAAASSPAVTGMFQPGTVCRATYDYHGSDEGDLSLKTGDVVVMIEELSKGWWNGRLESTGQVGLFPETYVTTASL
ncbi:hypothetical protein BASA81_007330 [Batrachochytrium salamandrivorans]|nr:hypothetical protein BASA81_007330 [Batrachochytrium salamandrivorans]